MTMHDAAPPGLAAGATTQVIITRLMTEAPRSIPSARPTVPKHVDAAVLRALSKAPADRFATCADFGRALMADAIAARSSSTVHSRSRVRDVRWRRLTSKRAP